MIRSVPVAVLLLSLVQAGAADAQAPRPQPLSVSARRAVADTVARTVRALYVLPDTARAMAAALERQQEAGRFDSLTDPNAFAAAVTRALRAVHHDVHLRIAFDPAEAARMSDTSRREVRDTRARDRKMNFQFREARILPGNIGYLEFHQFADTSQESRRTVRAAMQFVANTDALILDLRDNRGGSAAMAKEISGYFVKDSALWGRTYNRLLDRWTDAWTMNDSAKTGGTYLGMPITVLTSTWTFSAAEGLAYALKHQRDARVVGDSTAGGAHVVRRVGLGNGFIGFIPYIRGVNVKTNSNWDGIGVVPDVIASAPAALLRAQELILTARMASAADSGARRAAEFALNAARAAASEVDLPVQALEAFVGEFEEYTFVLRGNRLYAANRSRNGRSDKLVPVTATLFQIDREAQVEFLRDAGGTVPKLRIRWSDGWVDTIVRTRKP
jgi:hypothetical protein